MRLSPDAGCRRNVLTLGVSVMMLPTRNWPRHFALGSDAALASGTMIADVAAGEGADAGGAADAGLAASAGAESVGDEPPAGGVPSAGGDVGTFNQLFPLGHAYFGYIDEIGRQNILDLHPGLSVKCASDKLTVKAEGHFFWRAEAADALYNAGGGVVRRGAPGTSKDVGTEVDLVANYRFNRHLDVEVGYNHFFPGTFIKQTGPDSDINFFYLQTQIYF